MDDDATKTVTITKKQYDSLIRDRKELRALHAGGVDNWEWYSDSLIDAGLVEVEDEDDEEDVE